MPITTSYIKTTSNDGSSPNRAGTSASAIKSLTGTTEDGIYWLKPTSGSGNAFPAWCIMSRDGGGWVKALQFNSGVSMATGDHVNYGGAWTTSEISLNGAGKIHNTDWNALNTTNGFLFRVKWSGGDNLLNNGAGTGKLNYAGSLTSWGTDLDPTSNYTLYLDLNSNGTYQTGVTYTNDTRGRCNATTNYWISDHNYNGTLSYGSNAAYSNYAICWTIGTDRVVTNLHWMSGLAAQSGGGATWGADNNSAFAIYIK